MKQTYFAFFIILANSVTSLALAGVQQTDTNGWQSLFDGKTMGHWKPSDFRGCGKIEVKGGAIAIVTGAPMSGITWSNQPPARMDYEIQLEAMRTEGHDFFCGLTFPVGTNPCTLITGGWGGTVTGLSSINGYDASENETTSTFEYQSNRWYKITLKVTKPRIEAWIDDQQVVNLETEDKRFSIRWEVEPAMPLGISTWRTSSAIRNIRIRTLGSNLP